jgi:hypothetical protein
MAENFIVCWARLTEEERNQIRHAMRKYGPLPSKSYDNDSVIMISDREDVRRALLVYGTTAAFDLFHKLKGKP